MVDKITFTHLYHKLWTKQIWSKPVDFVLHETDGAHIKYNYLRNAILVITRIQFSQEFDALTVDICITQDYSLWPNRLIMGFRELSIPRSGVIYYSFLLRIALDN